MNQFQTKPVTSIVLIEDDEDDQEIFFTALARSYPQAGCKFFCNGLEAISSLTKKVIRPDLIFLDLNMPIMNGLQFLAEIQKNAELQTIPIIVLSTTSHAKTIALAKELGAIDFITKPNKFDELVLILDQLFKGKQ